MSPPILDSTIDRGDAIVRGVRGEYGDISIGPAPAPRPDAPDRIENAGDALGLGAELAGDAR